MCSFIGVGCLPKVFVVRFSSYHKFIIQLQARILTPVWLLIATKIPVITIALNSSHFSAFSSLFFKGFDMLNWKGWGNVSAWVPEHIYSHPLECKLDFTRFKTRNLSLLLLLPSKNPVLFVETVGSKPLLLSIKGAGSSFAAVVATSLTSMLNGLDLLA